MLVNRITAFLFGAGLASAIAVLRSSHSPTAPIEDKIEHWQARARKAEQELAVLHARLQSEAAQNPTISPSPVMAPAAHQLRAARLSGFRRQARRPQTSIRRPMPSVTSSGTPWSAVRWSTRWSGA